MSQDEVVSEVKETKEVSQQELDSHIQLMNKAELQNIMYQTNQLLLAMVNKIVTGNGVKQKDKGLLSAALINAILFSMDFGTNTSKVQLFEKGHKYYKENHTLAAMLVKAMDARMVLLAYQAKNEESVEVEADLDKLNELEQELE